VYEESDRLNKRLVGDEKGRLSKSTEKEPKPNAIAQITPNSQKSIKQVFSTRPKTDMPRFDSLSPLSMETYPAGLNRTEAHGLCMALKRLGLEAAALITRINRKIIKRVFSTRQKKKTCPDLLASSLYLGNDQIGMSHTEALDLHLTPKQLGSEDTSTHLTHHLIGRMN
jgi:hypothetical protein